jgi:hypothetical protein
MPLAQTPGPDLALKKWMYIYEYRNLRQARYRSCALAPGQAGMQRLSSMDYTTALLQFPYNTSAKSLQGKPVTGGLSVPLNRGLPVHYF